MKQHSIDLMPEAIRQRAHAVVRAGRFIAASTVVLVLTVVVATHSRLHLRSAEARWQQLSAQAALVQAVEAHANEQEKLLARTQAYIDLYERVALPLEISAVIATVVNALPESVTIDQLDLDAGARLTARSPRAKALQPKDEPPPRILTGEIAGFAASDQHIAELVSRLDGTPPFRDVGLDFSRTRDVHGRLAREFRLSFKIDLNTPYVCETSKPKGIKASRQQGIKGVHAAVPLAWLDALMPRCLDASMPYREQPHVQ